MPLGTWPRNKALKEIGALALVQVLEAMETLSLALFTRVLNWTEAETQILIGMARNELEDRSKHLYMICRVIYGKKPGNAPTQ